MSRALCVMTTNLTLSLAAALIVLSGTGKCPLVGGSLSNSSWSAGSACAHIFAGASTKLAEYCRQLLDPIVSPSDAGIDIEGIGARLMRDGHAEFNDGG